MYRLLALIRHLPALRLTHRACGFVRSQVMPFVDLSLRDDESWLARTVRSIRALMFLRSKVGIGRHQYLLPLSSCLTRLLGF